MRIAKTALLTLAFLLMSFSVSYAHDGEISFKVHNNTENAIIELLVSEDGKKYGYFDIGDGIAPGVIATLVWDKSAYDRNCVQYFKAVFDDDSESKPVPFDFCEDELVLEFGPANR